MAQRVQVILVDDVDGGRADETVSFSLDGTHYEIDLSATRAKELRADLKRWVEKARRVGAKSRAASRTGKAGDVATIRAWAKANGLAVNERGRISAEVRQAYASRKS
jgi:hypothetical protein